MVKVFKASEGTFKAMPMTLRGTANYLCHVWLPEERLAVGTDKGEVLLLEKGDAGGYEFRALLFPGDGTPVKSLVSFSKGFISGGGSIRIFDKSDDARDVYKCAASKEYPLEQVKDGSVIECMAVSPSEEHLICSTTNHWSFNFALGSTELLKSGEAPFFELLTGTEVHGPGREGSAAINGMDVCAWKPLLATCGRDRTVRIWNYKERSVEVTKVFDQEPLSVALHPTGLFILVGFPDGVQLLSVLMEDLRLVKELPNFRGCTELKFSRGGHLMAVAHLNAVVVLDTYECRPKFTLRVHQQPVMTVTFADRDRRLVTVGKDGNVFMWDARTGTRLGESMQPRTCFLSSALAGGGSGPASQSRLFCFAADRTVKAFAAGNMAPENQVAVGLHDVKCMVPASNGRALFLGTSGGGKPGVVMSYLLKDGKLPGKTAGQVAALAASAAEAAEGPGGNQAQASRAAKVSKGNFPPAGAATSVETQVAVAHSLGVSCMTLSLDGSLLFSGGEDGSLCMFDVREVDARGLVRLMAGPGKDKSGLLVDEKKSGGVAQAEEILVTKSDLVSKKRAIEALLERVEELKENNEAQLRSKDMRFRERVAGLTTKFQGELDGCRSRYEALSKDKEELEAQFQARLYESKDDNSKEAEDRKRTYAFKIKTERERKDALHEEQRTQAAEWNAANTKIVSAQKEEIHKLTAAFEGSAKDEHGVQARLNREKASLLGAWERSRVRIEDDCDGELDEIKMRYEARLKQEKETGVNLKAEHAVMKKKYQVLVKDVKEKDEEVKQMGQLEKQLRDVVKGLEKDILSHKKEMTEREETIGEKDKRIIELKKKNQELEKFKFVLDYKIKELKRQIEPRENEIADMRTQVEEMDLELEQYHKSNNALDLMIGELKLKIDGVQREVDAQRVGHEASQTYLARVRRDLERCASDVGDFKKLKHSIRDLFAKYVQEEDKGAQGSGGGGQGGGDAGFHDPQLEYNREREHLERSVDALKKKIAKDIEMFESDHARLTREGVNLTEEMNLLRREAKLLRRQQKSMDIETEIIMNGDSAAVPQFQGHDAMTGASAEAQRELEMQESQLLALENRARELELLLGTES